ncbi:hypothetical protein [Paeniglutamicibacter kerguelensis]|uniref:Uncharacterized protein n=1 Tax=Paeniglutamicibacter kerguelensis TaxID=254788 RepID=A0ABS4XJ40_9MICC|nr:hypothetical protein [Paeniglutamicibacter kerguelensis]MBP2388474.1 hypothetical protein [Paeniglutamicibacter kerguelensis]
METLLWVVVPLLILGLGWLWLTRLRAKNSAEVSAAITPETAESAALRLTGEGHRAVYRSLAQGDFMAAVQNYKAMTGEGYKASIIAVRSLERFPQIRKDPAAGMTISQQLEAERLAELAANENAEQADDESSPSVAASIPSLDNSAASPVHEVSPQDALSIPSAPAIGDDEAWVVPSDWAQEFGSEAEKTSTQFKVSYLVDGEPREFASEDLPPAEYDQFMSLVRDHDLPGAATLIAKYSGLDQGEILRMLVSSPLGGGNSSSANIADFSFEGQGPDGAVHFSVNDLDEPERTEFLDHLRMGELDEATAIVARCTGLPDEMVRTLLNAFGDGDK